MDQLVALHKAHEASGLPPEVEAAWLHHRFTQIHPFSDGNGRVARAIATLVFIKSGWFPLIVNRDQWAQYIDALEKADSGDLRPVVAMFGEAQRDALIQATEVAYDIRPVKSPHDAVLAVRERMLQRDNLRDAVGLLAERTAERLFQRTVQRLDQIAGDLVQEAGKPITTNSDYRRQAARLALSQSSRAELVVEFHAIGQRFPGFIKVVASLTLEEQSPAPIRGGIFQINYEESPEAAEARFVPWLDRVITEGLMQWRRTL
jgi:hypothetical protein